MKNNLFVFIALIFILWVPTSLAETGTFSNSGGQLTIYTASGGPAVTQEITYIKFHDPPTTYQTSNIVTIIDSVEWAGSANDSQWDEVSFKIGANTVGTGYFGFNKGGDGKYYVSVIFNADFDISTYTGNTNVQIVGQTTGQIKVKHHNTPAVINNDMVALCGDASKYPSTGIAVGTHKSQVLYSTSNAYTYTSTVSGLFFDIERDAWNTCKLIINNSFIEIVNETTVKDTNGSFYSTDVSNNSWSITWENSFGDTIFRQIYFATTSTGIIYLNQSSYTYPELLQIDAELTTYDFTNHIYRAYLERLTDDGITYSKISYVTYNDTVLFSGSNPIKSLTADVDYFSYEAPLRVRAVIADYNKATGVTSNIATSNTVLINPLSGAEFLVTGIVYDADTNSVISGATVSVTGPMTQSDTTGSDGRFNLYLSDGTYTFNTSKVGYDSNVDTIIISSDTSGIKIPLVPILTEDGLIYGTIRDGDTSDPLDSVHVIFTNATATIHGYSVSNGYYEATGLLNNSTYTVRALKSGYYSYNGSVTTEVSGSTILSFNMYQTDYSATPTATETSTYPGGSGYAWNNDDIVTMLRVNVPPLFQLVLILLIMAILVGFNGGNNRRQY